MEVQAGGLECIGMLLLLSAPPPYSASQYLVVPSMLNAWLRPGDRMSRQAFGDLAKTSVELIQRMAFFPPDTLWLQAVT